MSYLLSFKSLRHIQNVFKMLKLDIQQPSCDQFQNRVSADQCHMTVLQAQVYSVQLIEVTCFFIVFCLPVMVFKWSQAQQTLLQKYIFTSSHLAFGLGYSCSCWPFGQYTGSRALDRTRTACNCSSFKLLLTKLKVIVSNFWGWTESWKYVFYRLPASGPSKSSRSVAPAKRITAYSSEVSIFSSPTAYSLPSKVVSPRYALLWCMSGSLIQVSLTGL